MKPAQAQNIFHGNVGQDKTGSASGRTASPQPASDTQVSDRTAAKTRRTRSQTEITPSRAKVPFTLHVDPILKADVERQAEINGNSASAEGGALLEAIVRQKIHQQQAATLETTIERVMARAYRSMATQMAYFLVTILFELGKIKAVSTNTLGMQEGVTEELLKDILQDADKRTRASLARKNPRLIPLIQVVEEWLLTAEDAAGQRNGKKAGSG
jgi:predicted kinase